MASKGYDFIIVGAGSAAACWPIGSAEGGDATVHLLEAGGAPFIP